MSDGKLSLIAGITVATSDLVPDDTILVVGDPSVEDFYAAWDSPQDPYAIDFSDWRFKVSLGMAAPKRRPVLRRPSWLHPLRRVLWVHLKGPHVPEVKVNGGALPQMPLSFGKITGLTTS